MTKLKHREQTSFDYRKNSLNTLKILAALQVLYLHTITHLQISAPYALTFAINIFMGVPIFFILSGFLIWNSLERSSTDFNFISYSKKRIVRIYPELWLGVIIEIIILIIFLENINWLDLSIFGITQSTFFQFYTPDSLRAYGCGTPNGTLWTIGVTIQFYIVVWLLHKLFKNKSVKHWSVLFLVSILIKAASPYLSGFLPTIISKLYSQTIFPYLWMFILGSFIAKFQAQILPILKKFWYIPFAISFVFDITDFDIGASSYGVFTYLFRVVGLIGLCYNLPKLNIKFDFSYGLYIYHMIVVNLMIEFGFLGKFYYLIIATAISIILASASTLFGKWISSLFSKKTRKTI